MTSAFLPDRAVIRIGGADAESFLQALITTDIPALSDGAARAGALLTPQGKILFDFLIWQTDAGFSIEVPRDQCDSLVKRLTMYKLRAAVDLAVEPEEGVSIFWGEDQVEGAVIDGRFRTAGIDLRRRAGHASDASPEDYHALRIAHGIVEAGEDYALQDAFPHDILLDLNGGLSFRKGCYVGQEVVSRMQHRGTARRRVVIVTGETALPVRGTVLSAQGKPIGELGSVSGTSGLAIVRIDRAGEAMAAGAPILAGDVAVEVHLPAWSKLSFPQASDEVSA